MKLRGFRIELSDVQANVVEASQELGRKVDACLCVVREDQLITFVATEDPTFSMDQRFADALRHRLSPHMLHHFVVRLAIFPHTRNGKVDVSALPSPTMRDAFGNAAQNEAVMDTRLQVEAESPAGVELVNCLVSLFQSTLKGGAKIDQTLDFYNAYGDSLLAMQLISLASEQGIVLRTSDLKRHRIPPALARAVHSQCSAACFGIQ